MIIIEIPLPIPFSVILSPSHITNTVPVTNKRTVLNPQNDNKLASPPTTAWAGICEEDIN